MGQPVFGARGGYTQHVQFIGATVNYDSAGISTGVLRIGRLPANAFVLERTIDINTAFAATTTNVLTVGTVSGTATDIVSGGDVNETVGALTQLSTPLGVLNATQELDVYVKFTGAGAANTAGSADILIQYIDWTNK
jgi:hypothetical protein